METIQQNNNVIDGVNRETIYTQTMQSIDTMSIPQEGVRGHLHNKGVRQVQNLGQAIHHNR